jgi:hypothetical protein
MNKRIKKKQSRLKPLKIGDNVYTREYIRDLNKVCIGHMNVLHLYHQIKEPKLVRPRVKSLINYIYKNRMHIQQRPYQHLKFARRLQCMTSSDTSTAPKVISGERTMRYNSSTFIRFVNDNE